MPLTNPRYMFVHIGKAGGTTLYSNLRNMCVRKNIEHNLHVQKHHQRHKARNDTAYKFVDLPVRLLRQIKCLQQIKRQKHISQSMIHPRKWCCQGKTWCWATST